MWRWWRLAPLAAAAAVAVVAWRWPALLDSRTGSLVAATVTVLALAAASVAFLRTSMLPLAARLIASALAVYAILALLQGAFAGTTFGEMVRGASVWQPLPRWLRGAFVGGCLLLPLAAVVQAVKAGLRGWRRSSSTAWRELNQALVYALCATTALATWTPSRRPSPPVGGAATFAVPATPTTTSTVLPALNSDPAADVDPVTFAKKTDSLVDRISRVDWNVDARADALGSGVEPAFAYVRDAIRYEAYPGVLRGAAGTYTARAGNAADRAVLLAHLLEQKKIRTRFAIGTLDPAARERLWQRIFDTSIAGIPRIAPGTKPDPESAAFRQRVHARATRDYEVVRAALGDRLPPVTKPSHDEVLTEMNPHVWVQADVDGRWVDLDPSFPESKPGTTNTAIDSTVNELSDDLYQTVAIRVKVEQLSHGELSQTTVLDSSSKVVDLVDRQIFIAHVAGKPIAMANIGASLGGYNTWTPALWVSGEFTYGTTFTIDETGASAPAADAGEPQAPGGGGLTGVIDALSARPAGAPATTTAPTGPVFVAEWLEFELRAPGGQREVTRRILADRGSAAWRGKAPLSASGLARLERADDGPTSMRALHNVWLSGGPHDLAGYAEAMQDLAYINLDEAFPEDTTAQPATPPGGGQKDDREFGENVWPFALQNFAWMVWTDHGVIPRLNDTPGLRLYTDRPRIAIFTMALDRTGTVQIETDLRRDDLREVAAPGIRPGMLAEKKLWFGLLQGAFEHEMLASTIAAAGGDPTTVETTSARLSPDGVMVLTPADAVPASQRVPHPESAARLSAALSAGNVIVAPVGGLDARGSWWEIAPVTGDTRAVGALELHAGYGKGPRYNRTTTCRRAPNPPNRTPLADRNPTPRRRRQRRPGTLRSGRRREDNAKRADRARKTIKSRLGRQTSSEKPGNEYTLLAKIIMIVGVVAYTAVGIAVSYVAYMAIEAAISDLTDG